MWLLKASSSVSFRVYGSMELTSPSLAQRRVWAEAVRAVPQSRAAARARRRIVNTLRSSGSSSGATLSESARARKGGLRKRFLLDAGNRVRRRQGAEAAVGGSNPDPPAAFRNQGGVGVVRRSCCASGRLAADVQFARS